jgi:hypothetical protein
MCFSIRHVDVVTREHEKGSSCREREEPDVSDPYRAAPGCRRHTLAGLARQRVADLFGPGDLVVDAGGSWASLAHRR